MIQDFAIEDLKKTLAMKQKHLQRVQRSVVRLNETIARAKSGIESLAAALKKATKKEK